MVVCSLGSAPQAGAPAYYRVTDADLQTWFGSFYNKLSPGWWSYWLGKEYAIPALCALDPPIPQAISDLDIDLAGANPLTYLLVRSKLEDYVTYGVWSRWCQCNSSSSIVCSDKIHDTGVAFSNTPYVSAVVDLGAAWTSLTWAATNVINAQRWQTRVTLFNDAGATSGAYDAPGSSGTHGNTEHTETGSLSRGSLTQRYVRVALLTPSPDTSTGHGDFLVNGCATVSGTTTIPPYTPPSAPDTPTFPTPTGCTTDDLCKSLAAIKEQVSRLTDLTTLIQRQGVPFAYIPGPVFSGLTGNGEVAVSGILAVSVDASDHPLASVEFGHPSERYDQGWVNLGDADGWFERVQLGPRPTFIPSVPAYVTKIGYSLPPGVTATLRTWEREV